MPKTSRVASGFTLVEVLMAMLIMTVGLLGLLQSVNLAYEHNLRNRLREDAVLVGEEQMNNLRMMSGDTIVTFKPVTTVARVICGTSKNFTVTRECQPMGSSSRKLCVDVRWSFKHVSSVHKIYTLKNI